MPAIDQFSVIHHLFYEKWSGICHFHDIVCVYYGGSRIDQQFSQILFRHSMNETNPKLAFWLGDFQMASLFVIEHFIPILKYWQSACILINWWWCSRVITIFDILIIYGYQIIALLLQTNSPTVHTANKSINMQLEYKTGLE